MHSLFGKRRVEYLQGLFLQTLIECVASCGIMRMIISNIVNDGVNELL